MRLLSGWREAAGLCSLNPRLVAMGQAGYEGLRGPSRAAWAVGRPAAPALREGLNPRPVAMGQAGYEGLRSPSRAAWAVGRLTAPALREGR